MSARLRKNIDKYGPDIFLIISRDALKHIINICPAPDDAQWARLLRGGKPAARRAVLDQMNRLRRESISRQMESAVAASVQEVHDLFSGAGLPEDDFFESPEGQGWVSDAGMSGGALSAVLSLPFDLFGAELDEVLARWTALVHIGGLLGISALDPLLDAELDETSLSLLRLAMLSPAGRGFDHGLTEIRAGYQDGMERKLRAIAAALFAIGNHPDVEPATLQAELEALLGARVSLPPCDSDMDWLIPDGALSRELAELLLLLLVKVREEGILSVESSIGLLTSSFLADGLQLVCDGFAMDDLRRWLQSRQEYLAEDARRRFEVVASACWCLASGGHRTSGYQLMAAHTPYEIDRAVVREIISDFERQAPRVREDLIPAPDAELASYGMSRADDSYADPLEWFELRACLERLADDGVLPDAVDFLAKLALILPPHRWEELAGASVLPGFDAKEVFAYGFGLVQSREPSLPAAYLMNLVKNLGLEAAGNIDVSPEIRSVLSQLSALTCQDALLLPPDLFQNLLSGLTLPQVNALAHSAFGKRAAELGLPIPKTEEEVVQGEASRYALLAALAGLVVSGEWSVKEGVAVSAASRVAFLPQQGGKRPPKEWLVEGLEVDEDDIFAPNPADCFTFSPLYGLLAITGCHLPGCSLEDGVDIFRRLPVKTVTDILCSGVNESDLDRVNALVSSMERKARFALRKRLELQCRDRLETFDAALALGFEEVMALSDPYIREWLKAVSNEDLTLALARAPRQFSERVLGNLSERAAEMIAEDMEKLLPWMDPAEELVARMAVVEAAKAVDLECEARAAELEREMQDFLAD